MHSESSKSPLDFFAELGDLLARYATNPTYAVMMVIVGWVIWPIGALMASLLIASVYARTQKATSSEPGSQPVATTASPLNYKRAIGILAGLGLIAFGLYQLFKHTILSSLGSVVLIGLGTLIVLLAFARSALQSARASQSN